MLPSFPTMTTRDCVVTDRGGIVECRHLVHAAVVDATGRLLFTVGDASRVTLIRSAAKPAQALAIVETGCLEQFNMDAKDLALICASHSAEDRHVSRASSLLTRTGLSEKDLACGPHPPITKKVERQRIQRGETLTAIHNNCSGKHAGMLAGAKMIKAETDGYHLLEHPMQKRVKGVVDDLCDKNKGAVSWGIDGCNLPAPAMPLTLLALTYATFADAVDDETRASKGRSMTPERSTACSRIFKAMSTYPELVAGEDRFCTALMRAYSGALIGKVGAQGCYGIGIRESEQTKRLGASGAVGVAVKIEDGNTDILYSAVVEILQKLGMESAETRSQLDKFHQRYVLNTANVVVGNVEHAFQLQPVKSTEPASQTETQTNGI